MHRLVAGSLLLWATTARAQPGMTQPTTKHPDEKDEDMALVLSLGGTAGSYLAIGLAISLEPGDAAGTLGTAGLLGAMFAPSFGHWYGGTVLTRGLAMRAGGLVVAIAGALADSEGCDWFSHEKQPADCGDTFRTKKGTAMMLAGAALFVWGTIDDIITAPRRVRRHNETLRSMSLAPIVQRDGGGLALVGRF